MILPAEEQIALPDGPITIAWRRSARARRVSLRIDAESGGAILTLPPRGSRAAGLRLLQEHAAWVRQRLAALPQAVNLQDGAVVPIGGVPHQVRHVPGARRGAWIEDREIRVSGDPAFLRRRVTDLLRAEARRQLGPMAQDKARLAGLKPARITCKDTRSRWGSCSADGVLMFSWRLLMAPPFVQDYVTAHEVAHLRHMNHGPLFWQLVHDLTPHTAHATGWLKTEGPGLLRIG